MAQMTDSNWNELMTPLWKLGIFPLFNAGENTKYFK